MATLPFRPPQFSDDVAWLPPWLQPNHSQSSMTPFLRDDDNFPQSLQNVVIPKGDNNHAKESNLLLSGGSIHKPYNVCRLYLSGEDSSPITLTPCEKVLHFNLYLSTDGTSSINDTSQNDFIKSADDKALHPTEVLHSPRKNSPCNMDNDNSVIKLSPPPEKNCSGKVCKKTSCKSRNSKPDNSEIYNAKGAECDDIIDAIELSVAASEALVIHEMIQTEPILEAMSSAATLEVALRVKQARVDGVQDSFYCLKDTENISETLSDLSDSDLEDAYNDVGFSVSRLDNISSMDPSVSRVKDTPMTHIYPDGEREVQSEWNEDMEYFKDSFLARPMENNLGTDKSKDLLNVTFNMEQHEKSSRNAIFDSIPETPCHPGLENLDNIQVNQGENDRIDDDHLAHQNLASSLQLLHAGKTDMNKEDGGSSCRYQSRWLGGWGAKDGDCRGAKESNYAKPIRKMLINEASYLSESTYVAPDQNSVVNYHQSCSKSSEANKQSKDSCTIAIREALVSQDVVKDSNSSFTDSLCSMVPCSISSEIGKSSLGNKKIDNIKVITAIKSSNIGTKIPSENIQTSSGQNDEEIERNESTKLILGDAGPNPINRRQKRSLKDYSRGSPRNSPASVEKKFRYGLEEESNETLLYGMVNNSINPNDPLKPLCVELMPDCVSTQINEQHQDMRLLTVDQPTGCLSNLTEKAPDKQPLVRSVARCTTPKKSEQHYLNSVGRPVEDHCKESDQNQAQVHTHMQEIPKSPLVLHHRTRRFRPPKFPVNDLPTGIQADDQGPKNIYHKRREVPKGQLRTLPNIEKTVRKRVHFSDADTKSCSNKRSKKNLSFKIGSGGRVVNRLEHIDEEQGITSQEVKERLTNCCLDRRKKLVFQGLDFLLTGFSKKKEQEIEALLRKHGGMILSDIPTHLPRSRGRTSFKSDAEKLPVVICSRKLQTTTFLYGCAVNAFLLKAGWAYDSVKAGSVLPPDKYEILSNRTERMLNHIGKSITQNEVDYIFVKVGIMLHGTHSFCTRFAKCIKHGRGLVYKSLQWLVQSLEKKKITLGAIVVEEDNRATRHLKKYASEQKIPVMPASWIVNSLFEGKLLPVPDSINLRQPPAIKVPVASSLQDWSQEI